MNQAAPARRAGTAGLILLAVLSLRAVMAGLLPLTADEAYYWLWSKHLDAGYMDHPPAIAWLIRAGTFLLGDSAFGVRFGAVLLSGVASWFVWQSARDLLKDETRALSAVLLFNLTLMINVEMLAATPDMPSITTGAALLFCLARIQSGPPPTRARSALAGEVVVAGPRASEDRRGQGIMWLWAGVAAGLSLLSKYSALFLIAGAFLWLVLSPRERKWLKTPWPWAGAMLALLVFSPNLWWQTSHNWETFAFQFSRVLGHQLTGRFILEFFAAQLGLASPFIFILGVAGLIQARRAGDLFLPAMLIWPALIYFFLHALHDRVQGNWPCFLYPAFVILAAQAFGQTGWRKWCARLAAPVAGVILLTVYAQALTGFIPLGARDPLPRLFGAGVKTLAEGLARDQQQKIAAAILTTDYETTAWLRFYQPGLKVIQVGDAGRYPTSPAPSASLLGEPLLYVAEAKRDQSAQLRNYFSTLTQAAEIRIGSKAGGELQTYRIYLAQTPKAPFQGRMP